MAAVLSATVPAPLSATSHRGEIYLAAGVVGILMVMTVPLPAPLMDLLLAVSVTSAVLILLVATSTTSPLEFSVFPSLLLITTLLRLSLNVASTRLILSHGNEGPSAAGHVIQAFGQFVVGGNYVIGIIVFLILVLINFIVITKGAGRVAEVSARFTLDAMPGKQMSIDADLNAGLIDEKQARARRQEIEQEADFFGAMDGASKFVRGDAIAGIVITFINIIGGLIIGTLQQGLTLTAAAHNYTILTVGDGLVSQIPALVISTAAGIVVTNSASSENLGTALAKELSAYPRAMYMAAAVLALVGLVPGLPAIPFIAVAGVVALIARRSAVAEEPAVAVGVETTETESSPDTSPEAMAELLDLDVLELEVGFGLISLVDAGKSGDLLSRIKAIRRQAATDLGIIVPPIHIRDNLQLKQGAYRIFIRGVAVAEGEVLLHHLLAMDPGTVERPVEGVATTEPAFGLPALWISDRDREKAQFAGYTVVDLPTVLATHITEVVRSHAHELVGRQEVQELLDHLGKRRPKVVEELVPSLLSLGAVQKVLQNLLAEDISVRNLQTILEVLADHAVATHDPDLLTEHVRTALSRTITNNVLGDGGELAVFTLGPAIEEELARAIAEGERGQQLSMEPARAQQIIDKLAAATRDLQAASITPVLLVQPGLRRHLHRLTDRFIKGLAVLSFNEIEPDVRVRSVATVE
ncbi:MAG: flagellar biosynthesis protein FlhA [Nitrospirae bacterium CG18_big_fil_WC_8_21_14_2_50_70_55]|nr:flagellar biosynthesis protein FlhA [Deltaproteobacteria bacterium]OIP66660.1 MAG: flagellar biosynthesis protein FlhA [Nitrospirae bacterium CG2_30_70_394]PIQ07122.1 MAG: flagellar biosynthesis protein FlhA [Nitrospirae bacterium CG18_big_fil_WC_8_21_14_2_50_70_55]PIU77390.1 MAG: flagellar biosynthesis protein FlhA [Nitrospirae bacterium CG06_land_8_20_14_3_00_70_43]PIW81979.1 MAG: flagellar biosynthesis protein FlhA [Nitrospirae bacterium CG_4_8_14_3_um_filter_70_85]PIX83297.1 MAG: flagel